MGTHFILAFASLVAQPQEPPANAPQLVRVGLYVSPPFVMKEGDRYSGMAFDLWEAIARELDVHSEYREYSTFRELVQATSGGEVDVAVTNLTITQNRAEKIEFTHPWYDAGLRIMIDEDRSSGFREIVDKLNQAGFLRAYAWLGFVIVLATVLLTLFDRRFDQEFPRRWRDGLAESFYSVMSLTTSGKTSRKNPFGWLGRVCAGLWLVFGVAVVAYVTSTVTSVMTTLALTNQIHNVADLPGKTVGVFTGSVAEEYANDSALASRAYQNIDEAVQALLDGKIDAIIGDAPVLEYYAHSQREVPVSVVGPIFERDKYGFGFSKATELTKQLNLEVIGSHENDLVEELRSKYFGHAP